MATKLRIVLRMCVQGRTWAQALVLLALKKTHTLSSGSQKRKKKEKEERFHETATQNVTAKSSYYLTHPFSFRVVRKKMTPKESIMTSALSAENPFICNVLRHMLSFAKAFPY